MEENAIKKTSLTGSDLKWIAIITMVIDHMGAVILEPAISNGVVASQLSSLNMILRLIGRLSFPIFAFLLVEGYIHTRNVKKYILQMGLFALISEIPFDLANQGVLFNPSYQNIFFTLFIGLLTITLFNRFQEKSYLRWLLLIGGMLAASILKTDYSAIGILIIFVFYYFRKNKTLRNIVVSPLLFLQLTAVFTLLPIQSYNGKRGKQNKLFFYLFYPVHLILFYFIRILFFS